MRHPETHPETPANKTRARKNAARFETAQAAHRQGDVATAHRLCRQILEISPDHGDSLHLLGLMSHEHGRTDLAVDLVAAAVRSVPDNADYLTNLGELYRLQNQPALAEQCQRKAIGLAPTEARIHNNLGILLHGLSRLDAARRSLETACRLAPNDGRYRINLAAILIDLHDPDQALVHLDMAARIDPDDPVQCLTRGNALLLRGEAAAAATAYRAALAHAPDYPEAEVNLARALREGGDPAAALPHLARASTLAPDLAMVSWNAGLCHLLLGDYQHGWPGFRARFAAGAVRPTGIAGPVWQGEPLDGRTLLVHGEQGLGDTLQFARFLPLLKPAGAGTVLCLVQPDLIPLLADIPGVDRWLTLETALPPVDLTTPLMDLAGWLCPDQGSFGEAVPYVRSPWGSCVDTETDARARHWAALIPSDKPTIGLVWRGNPTHANDRNRSIALGHLAPLLQETGFTWYGLQRDMTIGERQIATGTSGNRLGNGLGGGLVDLGPHLARWTDTASAIARTDRIICCDTAIAHLAGAMGRSVDLLLPFAPDWRWGIDRSDSVWYPTMRLYRQPRPGDWQTPIAALRADLAVNLAEGRAVS